MEPRSFWLAMLGIGVASLFTQHVTFAANASFHLDHCRRAARYPRQRDHGNAIGEALFQKVTSIQRRA
jgi:hypothetical protein